MKIGIMTMHRVLNFGSALQAYALQKKLRELDCENELIDYIFPVPQKKKLSFRNLFLNLIIFLRNALIGFPTEKKKQRFHTFRKKYYVVSSKEYNHKNINQKPPIYDLYLTGSDQVWSPRHVKDNTDFMFPFAPVNAKIVSYAASFAVDSIPAEYQNSYANALSRYSFITVRESFGCNIVRQLTGKSAYTVCDPTLLLEKKDWDLLANDAASSEKSPYILVYILTYMYNPYPKVENLIKVVQQELGYKVIYLNGRTQDFCKPNSKIIKDSGPCEFLNLIRNAKFVITTSFHGVALACAYNIPFYGIVENKEHKGDRIHSLLQELNCMESLIAYDEIPKLKKGEEIKYACNKENLSRFRDKSIELLSQMIKM